MTNEPLKTPGAWCKLKGITMIDDDGWSSPDKKSYMEPISEEEFDRRSRLSTIQYTRKTEQ